VKPKTGVAPAVLIPALLALALVVAACCSEATTTTTTQAVTTTVSATTTLASNSPNFSGDWTLANGWTVVTAFISEAQGGRVEAERRAAVLVSLGIPADVLYSSDFGNLDPGWWATYSGEFGTPAEALAHAGLIRALGYSDCYPPSRS
jgi:ABC-type glycerol-3-phosphate transport system substrate-binding protein